MPTMTIACPACGARRKLEDSELGQKLRCACGMSFAASPVFAVPEEASPGAWFGRLASVSNWARPGLTKALLGAVVFSGALGIAIWLINRPGKTTQETGAGIEIAANTVPSPAAPVDVTTAPAPAAQGVTTPNPPASTPPVHVPVIPTEPPTPPPTPVARLSAVTLWDAFDLNPDDAAGRYVGKFVDVTARGKAETDTLGKTYFGAEVVKPQARPSRRLSPDEQRWEKEGYPSNVRCYLAPGQAAALESLPANRPIVLRGKVVGRKDRENVYRGYIVELQDCTIVMEGK